MTNVVLVVAGLAALGCKRSQTVAAPAPPAPAQKAVVTQPSVDPNFVHVDRDQLAALCLAKRMPPPSWASTYGALQLADGTRVPWLTVSVEETTAGAKAMPEKAWLGGARDAIDDMRMTWGKRSERTTTGDRWLKFPCSGDEVFWVVTTGVFFEAAGTHIFAMRETQLLEETLPVSTRHQEAFHRAFALTEQLLGQSATIATHALGSGALVPTVTVSTWADAAKK